MRAKCYCKRFDNSIENDEGKDPNVIVATTQTPENTDRFSLKISILKTLRDIGSADDLNRGGLHGVGLIGKNCLF